MPNLGENQCLLVLDEEHPKSAPREADRFCRPGPGRRQLPAIRKVDVDYTRLRTNSNFSMGFSLVI